MARQLRSRAEIFEPSKLPHWMVVENPWHKVLEVKELAPGTDLLRYFLELLLHYHNSGWKLHQFSANSAHFFATKDREQRYIQITCADPALPQKDPNRRPNWV